MFPIVILKPKKKKILHVLSVFHTFHFQDLLHLYSVRATISFFQVLLFRAVLDLKQNFSESAEFADPDVSLPPSFPLLASDVGVVPILIH